MKLPTVTKQFLETLVNVETPAIVYNSSFVEYGLEKIIRDTMHISNIEICYSLKANRNQALLNIIKEYGVGADVASMAELRAAEKAGLSPIYSTSPIFGPEEIECLYESGYLFDFNSMSQLLYTNEKLHLREIGLRIKVPIYQEQIDELTFGMNSRFGVNAKNADLINYIKKNEIIVKQIHVHIGEKKNIKVLKNILDYVFDLLNSDVYRRVEKINIGGGYTFVYANEGRIKAFWETLKYYGDKLLLLNPNLKIIIEPGMLIAFSCGFLVTKVVSADSNENKRIAVLDTSAFNLFSWHKPKPIFNTSTTTQPKMSHVLFGGTCYEHDCFLEDYFTNILHVDDKVIFHPVGAYVSSMKRTLHDLPFPSEYLYENGQLIQLEGKTSE